MTASKDVDSAGRNDRLGSVRYMLAGLFFINCALLYAMRLNLSVSITAMVNTTKLDVAPTSNFTCRDPHHPVDQATTRKPSNVGEFDWDESEQAMITYAFFVGYILTQIPGGYLAEEYSVSTVIGLALGLTSMLSCLTAVAARAHLYALLLIRFLEGLCEGVMYPCVYVFVSRWIPQQEQGLLMNFILSGISVGTIATMIGSAILCDSSLGWPSSFWVFGIVGIVFSLVWLMVSTDTPECHPWISPRERDHIVGSRSWSKSRQSTPVPWKDILLSPAVLVLGYEAFTSGLNFYVIATELPSYLKYMFGTDIIDNGFISGGAAFATATSQVICGWAADEILARELISRNFLRKFATAICCLVPCICLIIVALAGCRYEVIIGLMVFNCISQGASGAGDSMIPLGIAPNFPGIVQGVVNTMANVSGILAPFLVGYLTNNRNTIHQWNLVFYSIAIIGASGIFSFLFFGSTEKQKWNETTSNEDEDRVALLAQS